MVSAAFAVGLPQVAGLGLSFAVSIALARWLGASQYGTYVYALSLVAVLAVVGVFGLDTTLVRYVSVYVARGSWDLLRGLLRWANGVTLIGALILGGIALAGRSLLEAAGRSLPLAMWLPAAVLLPLVALLRLQQSTLRGLQRRLLSQLPESVVLPILMLCFVALAVWTRAAPPTAEGALTGQAVVAGIALLAGLILVFRAVPHAARTRRPRYEHRAWLKTSSRMLLVNVLVTLNGRIGILALGAMAIPQVVGPFAVALRGASFVPLALNITNIAMAPTIATAHAAGDRYRLALLARRMSQLALAGGLPIAIALLLWGGSFLQLFGAGFASAAPALAILTLGEIANVAAGPVATLLLMTGHERQALVGLGAASVVNLGLCLILIPHWGLNGAAVAGAASAVLWNVVLLRFVRRHLAISPTILGARWRSSTRFD
jgi:O-antigen/teichoic acid export membrane protein